VTIKHNGAQWSHETHLFGKGHFSLKYDPLIDVHVVFIVIFSPCFVCGHASINLNSWKSSTLVSIRLFFSSQYMAQIVNLHTFFMLIYCFRSIHMEWTYYQIYSFLFKLNPKSFLSPLWQVQSSPHELKIPLLIQTTN
jgi:hypothetical protein